MKVVLLHGLLMNDWVMRVLGSRLEQQGFEPVYFRYATTRAMPRARHHLIQETAAAKQTPPKKAAAVLS